VSDVSDTTTTTTERAARKVRQGVVVSDANDKTIVVTVERISSHALYGKTMKRSKKYHAHDENNDANVGDTVVIVETRPLSKNKRWRLQRIIERAK
jgi:small subunit ribosomal protein S17